MTSWQKRARAGVAIVGLASAVGVYVLFGERRSAQAPAGGSRLEPGAVMEMLGGHREESRTARQSPHIRWDRLVTFEDGTTTLIGVTIDTPPDRSGRTFVVTAGRGRRLDENQALELTAGVVLRDSDGFELRTDRGVYTGADEMVRADGAVTFSKGGMRGSGQGMTYALQTDLVRIEADADVRVSGDGASREARFTAGSATLDRQRHLLTLDRDVDVSRHGQVITTDRAVARLTATDDAVTFVELRGRSRVVGQEGPLELMTARDIDLDYSDEGTVLERSVLTGEAEIHVRGGGAAAGERLAGDAIDVRLAPDGSLARADGAGGVRVALPAGTGAPARTVDADTFVATDALADIRFAGHVLFREESQAGAGPRTARSDALTLEMASGVVASALFSGGTTFTDEDLSATAETARYQPGEGMLVLRSVDGRRGPRITDRRVSIDARAIDVSLDGRRIDATGGVKATFRSAQEAARAGGRGAAPAGPSKLPGLLQQGESATVTAGALAYVGASGAALFTDGARLWQSDTEIRAASIDLRQDTGNLVARGDARSFMVFDSDRSEGYADEIRYADAEQVLSYVSGPGADGGAALARLTGPPGDVRAGRIDVRLDAGEQRLQQLDARTAVTALVNGRRITGETLRYRAADERYDVGGTPARFFHGGRCMTGRALTYSRSTDTISIDGQADSRAQTRRGNQCP